jgi:Na+/proline symporter
MAKRIHHFSHRTKVMTPIELMSRLKGDPNNLIKILGGGLIGFFILIFLAGQFVSGAKAATVFNIDFNTAAILSAVLVMVYMLLGGVRAVMWTDAIQGLIMIVGFFTMIIAALVGAGGLGNMLRTLANLGPAFIQVNNNKAGMALVLAMSTWIGIAALFLGQPTALQKYMTMRDDKGIRKAGVIAILFNSMRLYFPVLIGLCGRVIFPVIDDPEMIVPRLITEKFPGIFGGVMLASIFAAIMSTTDSILLQSTSEITRNVLQLGILREKNFSEQTYGKICKWLVVLMTAIGLWIALFGPRNVFALIGFASTGVSCSVGPALFLGFLWKKSTSWGILASLCTGIPATALWFLHFKAITGLHEGVFGLTVSCLVSITVSLLTHKSMDNKPYLPDTSPVSA